jgi:putative oxidoreductase
MILASSVSRYFLGFIFVVFGLNGFLNFIPPQPFPALAMQFFGSLVTSHYSALIFALQFVIGVLLLVNRFVPLALVILGAIIVNIIAFHAFMAPSGLPVAIVVAALWVLVAIANRSAFDGLLQPGASVTAR